MGRGDVIMKATNETRLGTWYPIDQLQIRNEYALIPEILFARFVSTYDEDGDFIETNCMWKAMGTHFPTSGWNVSLAGVRGLTGCTAAYLPMKDSTHFMIIKDIEQELNNELA